MPPALAQERSEAWFAYKRARRAEGRNSAAAFERLYTFKGLNRTYRNFSINSQKRYKSNLLSRPDNRKLFHSYVRSKKIGRPAVGPLWLPGGEIVQDPEAMSEVFAASFS